MSIVFPKKFKKLVQLPLNPLQPERSNRMKQITDAIKKGRNIYVNRAIRISRLSNNKK